MGKLYLLVAFLIFSEKCYSQEIIGKVTDSAGKAVPFASINLKNSRQIVVAYALTTENGTYQLQLPLNNKDSLLLAVNCIGFKPQSKSVSPAVNVYNFRLLQDMQLLKTVEVSGSRPPRLRVRGDTLSYKVSDFKEAQDRVIGDVLRKLPGINVDDKGRITYNGKPISDLYIDGDNLLDDRYNIATNTIPADVVDTIQVYQNHQEVRALLGKVKSDDVAINISIKNDARLQMLGQLGLGAGLPGKYDVDANSFLFKKNFKAINYIKANDIGTDIGGDLTAQNSADFLKGIDLNEPGHLLSLGNYSDPGLPLNRYLFNHAALVNLNNLVKLKKNLQLKLNLSYLHDEQTQTYSSVTRTYVSGDTINYTQQQSTRSSPNRLHAQLNLNINKEQYYLNEAFSSDLNSSNASSQLNENGAALDQLLHDKKVDFANELNFIKTFKSGLILTLYSYTKRITDPESLAITPGLNLANFNEGVSYDKLIQNVQVPTLNDVTYLSVKQPVGKLMIDYKVGLNLQKQHLQSDLNAVDFNGKYSNPTDSTINELFWSRQRYFIDVGLRIPLERLDLSLDNPVIFQQTDYHENAYQLTQAKSQIYFNPRLSVNYKSGTENNFAFNYGIKNDIGTIDGVYKGIIVTDFRTINSNAGGLINQRTQSADLSFHYRKAIEMLFGDITLGYSQKTANSIDYNIITSSLQKHITLPFSNSTEGWFVRGHVSKYVFFLHATVGAGAFWQSNASNQIANGTLLPFTTRSSGFNANADFKISKIFSLNYLGYVIRSSTFSELASGTSVLQIQQQAALNIIAQDNLIFKLSADSYALQQHSEPHVNYYFGDISGRYDISKKKIELELGLQNLFNVNTFKTAFISDNTYTFSNYRIPGRMMLLKVTFNY